MTTTPLLLGTTNAVKIQLVRAAVQDLPITLLTPADLQLELRVAETGQTTQENAILKARAYFARTGLPTLAIDGGLWVEKFPAEQQPGVQIMRLPGLDDNAAEQAVLDYYIQALTVVGGESLCTWEGSLALLLPGDQLLTSTFTFQSLLTTRQHGARVPGLALGTITIDPTTQKYYSELTWAEHPDAAWLRQFLQQHFAPA